MKKILFLFPLIINTIIAMEEKHPSPLRENLVPMTIENVKKELIEAGIDPSIINNLKQGAKRYLFFTHDASGHTPIVIKTDGGFNNPEPRIREVLSYEIAKEAGLDDVVAPTELVGKHEILLSSYVYLAPNKGMYPKVDKCIKEAYPDLDTDKITAGLTGDDPTKKGIERIAEKCGWISHNESIQNIDPVSFQKAFIFSFLTFQQDLNFTNILFTVSGPREKPYIKPVLFDTAFSMTEGSVLKIIPHEPSGQYLYQKVGLREGSSVGNEAFFISRKQPIEEKIKQIVENLSYEKFEHILTGFDIDDEDKESFKQRILNLKEAFSKAGPEQSIGDVMEHLFIIHEKRVIDEKNQHYNKK